MLNYQLSLSQPRSGRSFGERPAYRHVPDLSEKRDTPNDPGDGGKEVAKARTRAAELSLIQ